MIVNMITKLKQTRGFTLIELIIVLAVLGVLAAIVVPNVAGYLEQGKDRAFKADQKILQAAVDAWRTDFQNRPGNQWPTVGDVKGTPTDDAVDGDYVDAEDVNSFIKVSDLSPSFLKGTDAVASFYFDALVIGDTGATNDPVGSYYWFIDTNGVVTAWYDADDDQAIDVGETGYQEGIYP